jgi:hypothetical protein
MDFAASHPPNSQARDDDTAPRLSIASAHRRFARGAHCPLSRSAGKKTSPRTANKKRVGRGGATLFFDEADALSGKHSGRSRPLRLIHASLKIKLSL